MRSTLTLFLTCLAPLLLSAAPGAGPPDYSRSQSNAQTLPTTTKANASDPNCTDLSSSTGAVYPSCWDSLEMNQWMFNWNFTTKTCENGELWSTCFLRLAYGSAGYDCSTLGSVNCTGPQLGGTVQDPRVFYGAFNIYGTQGSLLTCQTFIADQMLSLSRQSLPHNLGNRRLRPKVSTGHRAACENPRCGRRRRSLSPEHLIPPRRHRVSLRSRYRRRPSLSLHPTIRQQSDKAGHERDLLFDAAGDSIRAIVEESEQRSLER